MYFTLFYLLLFSTQSCSGKEESKASVESKLNPYMLEALNEMVVSTPLTVVFEYKDVTVEALPDNAAEERHIYCGKVLEVIKGAKIKDLCYFAIYEKGEEAIVPSEAKILSLCENASAYYWPGVGSAFPLSDALKEKAKIIAATAKQKKKAEPAASVCES